MRRADGEQQDRSRGAKAACARRQGQPRAPARELPAEQGCGTCGCSCDQVGAARPRPLASATRDSARRRASGLGAHMRAARAKIGAAVRSAWRCRSLEITGIYIERDGVRQYVTGEKVAPLSRRDVYILSRAADRVWWSWNYFGFKRVRPRG